MNCLNEARHGFTAEKQTTLSSGTGAIVCPSINQPLGLNFARHLGSTGFFLSHNISLAYVPLSLLSDTHSYTYIQRHTFPYPVS